MKLTWDDIGKRFYETGVDRGVLYPFNDATGKYDKGEAWNGLTNVSENPSGAEPSPLYADNIKYLNLMSAEEFGGNIECYTYPDSFKACNGEAEIATGVSIGQQSRRTFGLSYRTLYGNDTKGTDYGYKLHLVYGCLVSPSERAYNTVNDSPEAVTFSYEFTTTPVPVTGFKPTSCLTIDSTKVDAAKLTELENLLYGGDDAEPSLPLPDEVATLVGKIEG